MVGKIKDYEFQTQCVEYLIDKTVETSSKQVITVKAPTGAGKTIILIKYVDEFRNGLIVIKKWQMTFLSNM